MHQAAFTILLVIYIHDYKLGTRWWLADLSCVCIYAKVSLLWEFRERLFSSPFLYLLLRPRKKQSMYHKMNIYLFIRGSSWGSLFNLKYKDRIFHLLPPKFCLIKQILSLLRHCYSNFGAKEQLKSYSISRKMIL